VIEALSVTTLSALVPTRRKQPGIDAVLETASSSSHDQNPPFRTEDGLNKIGDITGPKRILSLKFERSWNFASGRITFMGLLLDFRN
jgi:hypothetical protein